MKRVNSCRRSSSASQRCGRRHAPHATTHSWYDNNVRRRRRRRRRRRGRGRRRRRRRRLKLNKLSLRLTFEKYSCLICSICSGQRAIVSRS